MTCFSATCIFLPAGTGWMAATPPPASSRLREPKDLRGLTVGLGAIGSVQMSELDVLTKRGGLTMEDLRAEMDDVASWDLRRYFQATRS